MHLKPLKQKLGSLVLAAALAFSLAAPASAADPLPFSDVKEGQWFYNLCAGPVRRRHRERGHPPPSSSPPGS